MSIQPINNDKLTNSLFNNGGKVKTEPNPANAMAAEDKKVEIKADAGENLREAVDVAVERLKGLLNRDIVMNVDKELKRVIVKIIDSETGDVVREVPLEEILNIAKKLTTIEGVLFDKEV